MTPHHTTRLRKSDVGSCFQQLHEDYHDPINVIQHLELADMCSQLKCAVGLILSPISFVTLCSPTRPILPAMKSKIQEAPFVA